MREENKVLKAELDTLCKRVDLFDSPTKVPTVDSEFKFIHEVQKRIKKSKIIIMFSIGEENNKEVNSSELCG